MPDLTLSDIVAHHYAGHVQHTRHSVADELRRRAASLRLAPSSPDPVVEALTASCHTEAGRIHSAPHLVAAAACEAVAALLETPSNEEEESRG